MPGVPVLLGPFTGGMSNRDEIATIADNEVYEATNFEFQRDGSMVSRPAIVFEADQPEQASDTVIATNLATNPRFSVDATGVAAQTAGGGAFSYARAVGTETPFCGQITVTTATSSTSIFYINPLTTALTSGDDFYCIVRIRASINATINATLITGQNADLSGSRTSIQGTPVAVVGGAADYVDLIVSGTVPADRLASRLAITVTTNLTLAATIKLTSVTIKEGLAPTVPFDGDTVIAGRFFGWSGTTGISISYEYAPVNSALDPLGVYVRLDGRVFLVVTNSLSTYLYDVIDQDWTEIWGEKASGFVQYDNKVVLISETVAGGYWEAGSFTATATMPLGSQIVFYQERFWAAGARGTSDASTVWFSNLTVISPASSIFDWTVATDYFLVGQGDGQWITALRADSNALIIFRNLSTWQFSFPGAPEDGTLRRLSATIGADNKWSVEHYEGYYFVLNQGYLYQFINYQFYPLNTRKISFERTALGGGLALDLRLSLFGARAIVWYLGTCYVYSIITSTWSRWVSPDTAAGQFLMVPPDPANGDMRIAYAISGENDVDKRVLYRIQEDALLLGAGEDMVCLLRTKAYAFDSPAQYKRMTYWTAEISSANGMTGSLHPTSLPVDGVSWDELEDAEDGWDTLDEGNWDNPLIIPSSIVDTVPFPSQSPVRTVVKLTRDGRFLRQYFEIRLETTGTVATGPVRIYSITGYLMEKAKTSRKVS